MSICVVNGGPCQCQPSEGFPCPGVTELRAQMAGLLAEKDAEIERLKTVPMKYRRMAFNAQLQEENKALRTAMTTGERKVRLLTNQRDKAKGRTRELQAYVTKYQREIADLKKFIRNMKDPS